MNKIAAHIIYSLQVRTWNKVTLTLSLTFSTEPYPTFSDNISRLKLCLKSQILLELFQGPGYHVSGVLFAFSQTDKRRTEKRVSENILKAMEIATHTTL